ncbi:YeeE/YedE family protein [Candidatus Dependentiae bacterium]|nr:YeeE/YedE family protein [Candidatus Dependentiae bacterium]
MNILKKTFWSPYSVGSAIGLIAFLSFVFMRKTIGISTAFIRIYSFFVGLYSLDHISKNLYLSKYVEYKPVFEWQVALLVGIFAGAFLSARLSGGTFSFMPYLWGQRFGFSKKTRAMGASFGGFLMLFGARMAGGCTMGHGISEGMLFVSTAWIFLPVMFLSGIMMAHILYRNK